MTSTETDVILHWITKTTSASTIKLDESVIRITIYCTIMHHKNTTISKFIFMIANNIFSVQTLRNHMNYMGLQQQTNVNTSKKNMMLRCRVNQNHRKHIVCLCWVITSSLFDSSTSLEWSAHFKICFALEINTTCTQKTQYMRQKNENVDRTTWTWGELYEKQLFLHLALSY